MRSDPACGYPEQAKREWTGTSRSKRTSQSARLDRLVLRDRPWGATAQNPLRRDHGPPRQ
eukprot:9470059-Pyramimonas_sp.AAC.1